MGIVALEDLGALYRGGEGRGGEGRGVEWRGEGRGGEGREGEGRGGKGREGKGRGGEGGVSEKYWDEEHGVAVVVLDMSSTIDALWFHLTSPRRVQWRKRMTRSRGGGPHSQGIKLKEPPPGGLCCVVDSQGAAGVGTRQLCARCARRREGVGVSHLEQTLVLWSCELGPLLLVVLVTLEAGREGCGY